VKNITVSVPDDVYKAARVRAAERDTSVSALVADFLVSLAHGEAEFQRLEDQQRRITNGIKRFSASNRVGRDDLHGRALR
jgi:hypothetical protein